MSSHRFNIAICVLLLTPLRVLFIVFAPIIIYCCIRRLKFKIWSIPNRVLTLIFVMSSFWGIIMGTTTMANIFLSWWIVYPIFLFMFSTCNLRRNSEYKLDFVRVSTKILMIVNSASILYACLVGFDPDIMGVAYGRHFNAQNGLAIFNIIFSVYYFSSFLRMRKKRNIELYYSLFFFFCFMLCECGLAFLCFIITIIVISFSKQGGKYIFVSIVLVGGLLILFSKISSDVHYYMNSLSILMDSQLWETNFRKLMVFVNYLKIIGTNLLNFILGIGPGGYNSRIAFLLNEDADNIFTMLFGHVNPKYHQQLVQPLWDKSELDAMLFNDGSRNKPFSSLLSILAEYGIIVFFIVCSFFARLYFSLKKNKISQEEYVTLFFSVFFFLMLLLDQWLETNEMFYVLLLMKILNVNKQTIKV